ncbi:MAG: glyoxalase superfamily protein [Ilumatobacteraceae bacterium]
MTTDVIPVLRVADGDAAAAWYSRLGFETTFQHRFGPGFPLYRGIRREGTQIHLSEHAGDATADTLVYVWVDDIDLVATEFALDVTEQPWAREVELIDPDGNRLRVAQRVGDRSVDSELGAGTAATLAALEHAMWNVETRCDRSWMEDHLTEDFTEFGYSGRTYDKTSILDQHVSSVDIELPLQDLTIRTMGRDAALVTYHSVQSRGTGNRASVWRRSGASWRLSFHQGTPADR